MSKPLMQGPFKEWTIIGEERELLMGPCGCTVENSPDGIRLAAKHVCTGQVL